MHILCAICQDLLNSACDIFSTPCGHVFHFLCLRQWLDTSLSCPECRQKVKNDSIKRIYFNISSPESIREDSVTLQQKVDSLACKANVAETRLKNCLDENSKFKKHNIGLREEVKKLEGELNQKNSAIHALKEQSLYFKRKCEDQNQLQEENEKLRDTIDTYKNVKLLLCGTSDDVDKIVSKTTNSTTLSTYVAVMKRELSSSLNKRKELRESVKRLQHDIQTLKAERSSLVEGYQKQIEDLEEALVVSTSENEALKKRLNGENKVKSDDKLAQEVPMPSRENAVSRKRNLGFDFDIDMVVPPKLKRVPDKLMTIRSKKLEDSDCIVVSPDKTKSRENGENSPYLVTKSKSILPLKERATQRGGFLTGSKSNVFLKTSTPLPKSTHDTNMVLDGFGGYSKIEAFPAPKSPNKLKRSINESSKSKKLKLNNGGHRQMDDYVINLS